MLDRYTTGPRRERMLRSLRLTERLILGTPYWGVNWDAWL